MADIDMLDNATQAVAAAPPPPPPVFIRCRPHITELPVEMIQMIGNVTPIEDLARLIRTCRTLRNFLISMLYNRAVKENNYHAAVVHCTLRNRVTPLRALLDAGAILGTPAARQYSERNFQMCRANTGFIAKHPLITAASLGHAEIVQLLMERGREVNYPALFGTIMTEYNALMNAITEGQVDVVRVLVEAGSIDLRGEASGSSRPAVSIPLVRAATHKNLAIVKIIAAKLKAERDLYRTQTYNSQCGHALRAAIKADSHQIVEFFLHDGADPNSSRTSESLLYTAVTGNPLSYDRKVIVELLLAYGASTEPSDPGLIVASWAKNFDVVERVLNAGCRWKYKGREVRWARLLAGSAGRQAIVRLWDDYMNRRIAEGDEIVE